MNSAVVFFTTFLLAVASVSNATSCKMTEKLNHCTYTILKLLSLQPEMRIPHTNGPH